MTMTQEEYMAGMLQQTHNKDEDLRDCTYVATFINFIATKLKMVDLEDMT